MDTSTDTLHLPLTTEAIEEDSISHPNVSSNSPLVTFSTKSIKRFKIVQTTMMQCNEFCPENPMI